MWADVLRDNSPLTPSRFGRRMNKRLLKRHKRQVARAKEAVKLSEPDVRTPVQLATAREASRAVTGPRNAARPHYSTPSANHPGLGAVSADVDS